MLGWLLAIFVLGFIAGHTVCYLKARPVIALAKEVLREQVEGGAHDHS